MKYTTPLKKNYEFKRVFKRGYFYKEKNLILYVLKNNEQKNYFGICVSKKNGNSVIRNKLKRWIREIYKANEVDITKGNNFVFLYRKTVDGKSLNFETINREINSLISMWKKNNNE